MGPAISFMQFASMESSLKFGNVFSCLVSLASLNLEQFLSLALIFMVPTFFKDIIYFFLIESSSFGICLTAWS